MNQVKNLLDTVATDGLKLFEYYRNGPIPMPKLRPGFIFQACVDAVLAEKQIVSVEKGLGDHCVASIGTSIQLKTTTQLVSQNSLMFCRSSETGLTPDERKLKQIVDVETRIQQMFTETETNRLVLLSVNLSLSEVKQYLLYENGIVVGDWLKPENVCTPFKQTHFWVKTSHMQLWA